MSISFDDVRNRLTDDIPILFHNRGQDLRKFDFFFFFFKAEQSQ